MGHGRMTRVTQTPEQAPGRPSGLKRIMLGNDPVERDLTRHRCGIEIPCLSMTIRVHDADGGKRENIAED